MITNERQYRIAGAAIRRFQDAIAEAANKGPTEGVDPRIHDAMVDGLRSQLEDLESEASDYRALREGKIKGRQLHSLSELPQALIEGRIAARLTQRQLAHIVKVPEQQIQRYEQSGYRGASIERLQEIAAAVKLTVRKDITYHVPAAGKLDTTRRLHVVSGSTRSTKGQAMAGRRTGKAAASAAGKTLRRAGSSAAAKSAAASDLAQVGNRKTTSKKAASAASKTLRAKGSTKAAKSAAASDLAQARPKGKR
jgi:transcriptional regulator with XRE-family HTH domain